MGIGIICASLKGIKAAIVPSTKLDVLSGWGTVKMRGTSKVQLLPLLSSSKIFVKTSENQIYLQFGRS